MVIKEIFNTFNSGMNSYAEKKEYRYAARLAEGGNKDGQVLLAQMYETGNAAVKQDWVSAYILYHIAAQKGITEAKHRLELLEAKLPAKDWQEAQSIISKLNQKD